MNGGRLELPPLGPFVQADLSGRAGRRLGTLRRLAEPVTIRAIVGTRRAGRESDG